MKLLLVTLTIFLQQYTFAQMNTAMPPKAKKVPYQHKAHSDVRNDDYYWLNGYFYKTADTTDVVNYLKAENEYTAAIMKPTEAFQKKLYEELKGRIKQDDQSPPYYKNGYWYYSKVEKGKDYGISCRKKGNLKAAEEVLIDQNVFAAGKNYFSLGGLSISPNNKLMAYSVDYVSRRQYTIYIKNLETGELYKDELKGTSGGITWANDNATIFYTANNQTTLLSEKIMKHKLGTTQDKDIAVYTEKDNTNYIGVGKSNTDNYIYIYSGSTTSTEVLYIDANKPDATFAVVTKRMPNVLYDVNDYNNKFIIVTNKDAINFKVVEATIGKSNVENWKDIIPHRKDVYVEGISIFKNHWVINERKNALVQLGILNPTTLKAAYINFGEKAYTAYPNINAEYNTDLFRYSYQSMTTPASIIEYNVKTKKKTILKENQVLGSFKKENYVTDRIYAIAKDGVKVPISIVYKKGTKLDGSAPMLLYAYGSYGNSSDASFSSNRLSLLDRGFVYALAHIRGGADMGRQWYEDGKMLKKKNTFTDFIDCAEYLVAKKYAHKNKVYAMGGSAGGLLMGAIINMRPDLWKAVVAAVPFVDVITTMSDENIPLTSTEWEEWGNPIKNKDEYFYMKSYSPYDNVENKNYPNMLVTTGLHDSQVQYFEPAKWVALLREQTNYKNTLLLKTNMDAGHGGASGRFKYLEEVAFEYAFLLMYEGIME